MHQRLLTTCPPLLILFAAFISQASVAKHFMTISDNEYTRIAQDFCSFSRRKKGHIVSHATLYYNNKKPSRTGIFFAGNRLIWHNKNTIGISCI
jgi:hypothetical protein